MICVFRLYQNGRLVRQTKRERIQICSRENLKKLSVVSVGITVPPSSFWMSTVMCWTPLFCCLSPTQETAPNTSLSCSEAVKADQGSRSHWKAHQFSWSQCLGLKHTVEPRVTQHYLLYWVVHYMAWLVRDSPQAVNCFSSDLFRWVKSKIEQMVSRR